MFRALHLAALAFLAASTLACAPAPQGENADAGEARPVYSGYRCGQADGPVARWLVDEAALRAVVTGAGGEQIGFEQTEPPQIDFDGERALLVAMGQRPTGGYAVKLSDTKVAVEDGTAMVRIDWIEPPPDAFVTQALSSPCLVLALPRGDYDRLTVVDQDDRTRFELEVP